MQIRSEVYIIENPTTKQVATATLIIEGCFVVKGLKVFEGTNGYFVAMPNRKTPNGEYKDIAFPTDKETREQIQCTVLQEYERKLQEFKTTEVQQRDLPF